MKAPRRLLDDPAALSVMREDLQNTAADQVSYDVTRGLASLESTLGEVALGEVAAAGASAGAAGSAAAGVPIALKWVVFAAIGGSLLGTAAWLTSESEPKPAPAAGVSAQPAAVSSSPTPAPALPQTQPQTPPTLVPEPAAAAEPADTSQVGPSASRREIAQLVRIRALLERDPAAARRAIAAAQREFPSGVLREEREGLDAIALFQLGEARRARTRAERFIERYPQSPLRPRLERLLAGESP